MDKAKLFDFLDKATDVVKAAAPLATMMGIPFIEKMSGWADAAVDVGKHAIEAGVVGKEVLTSNDVNFINDKIAALEISTAAMAAEVDAS